MKPTRSILFSNILAISSIFFSLFPFPTTFLPAMDGSQLVRVAGTLTILWGDPPPAQLSPTALPGEPAGKQGPLIFFLTTDDGQTIRLRLPLHSEGEPGIDQGSLLAFNRQRVTVDGSWLVEPGLNGAGGNPVLVASSILSANPVPTLPQDVIGSTPWVSVLCKFSGNTAEPHNLAFFQNMYANTPPGLDHFWRENSYDKINLLGSTASGWFTLPHDRTYYVYDKDGDGENELDFKRAAVDCTAAADPYLYFPTYTGINLMFNDNLDGYAWGGSQYLKLDGVSRYYSMTWEPPWGYANISVIAHETGHGFGLPHSSGNYGQVYDNAWDVMSDAWICTYPDPVYGCVGQHTISYHKDILGWIGPSLKFTAPFNSRTFITLERLALPQTANFLLAKIPIGGSSTHFYTVEARQRVAYYDGQLPGDAVIIHEVDTNRDIPAHVIDIDGNGSTGDAGAMWEVGETFSDPDNQVVITVHAATPTGYVVSLQNGVPPVTGCDSQTQIPDEECQALLALYGSTNGPDWNDKTGWSSSPLPCSWKGVVCDASHVVGLNLTGNNLGGYMPFDLENLPELTTLDLSANHLNGEIPEQLANLSSLQQLSLSNNQLSGSLPGWLDDLAGLQNLALDHNNFSGSLPPWHLENWVDLESLDLSHNKLSGLIPQDLDTLTSLQYLYLNDNRLSYGLPTSLGDLSSLLALHLEHNHLSGSIPTNLSSLGNLQALDLSGNRLEGTIPATLGALSYLATLDLHSNQLSGDIPTTLASLSSLSSLDLDYNLLTTTVPSLATFLDARDPSWDLTQTLMPANLHITALPAHIQLTWSPILYTADSGGYQLWYADHPAGPFQPFGATLSKTITFYEGSGLSPGKTYYLIVRACTTPHADQQNTLCSDFSPPVSIVVYTFNLYLADIVK